MVNVARHLTGDTDFVNEGLRFGMQVNIPWCAKDGSGSSCIPIWWFLFCCMLVGIELVLFFHLGSVIACSSNLDTENIVSNTVQRSGVWD